MDTWLDYKKLFESIDLYELLDEVFKNNMVQKEVIRLNQEQLWDGIDSNNREIKTIGGNPYSLKTIRIKEKRGQPVNRVTLYDTGDFYNSFGVKVTANGYEITADYIKEDGNIMDNFLSFYDFMGLTDESLAELVENQVLYQLTKLVHQKLGI
jgi:hypothetical protein